MKNQKVILGLFLILSASSTNAQLDLILFAGNTAVHLAETAILGVCFVTNLHKGDVGDAFFASIFNGDNPKVTKCSLGCAVTGLYEGKSVVQKFTGVDLTQFVSNFVGKDLYNMVDDCFNATTDQKCTLPQSYGTCIVPKIVNLVQGDIKGIVIGALNQAKNIVTGFLGSIGNFLPFSQLYIQPIQALVDMLFGVISANVENLINSAANNINNPLVQAIQGLLDSVFGSNTGSSSSDWNPFSLLDIFFPKGTTEALVQNVISSTTLPPSLVTAIVSSTEKANQDPISGVIDAIFRNIPFIG